MSKVGKWESGKPRHKKVAMKAKIIAKKLAQSEIILYLCNKLQE